MSQFEAKTICILGRQPALGLAELESLYGPEHLRPLAGAALLDIPAEDIDFRRLGGTIKTARILARRPQTSWPALAKYLLEQVPAHLKHLPEGKFTLGLSAYGIKTTPAQLNRLGLQLKTEIKQTGRPIRVVPNKDLALNSAQVLHNKLTYKGAWELLYIKAGAETLLAQTLFVQDIEAYAARDQARPARDARIGMLPPKLAQIIINLAVGQVSRSETIDRKSGRSLPTNSKLRTTILDPFCGSGVILQEALLSGYSVLGTDIEPRLVDYSKKNLQWLFANQPRLAGQVALEVADATSYQWSGFSTVASETYLGRPLSALPSPDKLKPIINDVNTILQKSLKNLQPQLKTGRPICLAVPAWRQADGRLIHLPLLDKLTDMGYTRLSFKYTANRDLIYYRENQVVARELLVLTKA